MTKERVTFSWKMVAGRKAFFITSDGPQSHDSCGFLLALRQGLKPSSFAAFTARPKSCPDTKPERARGTQEGLRERFRGGFRGRSWHFGKIGNKLEGSEEMVLPQAISSAAPRGR